MACEMSIIVKASEASEHKGGVICLKRLRKNG